MNPFKLNNLHPAWNPLIVLLAIIVSRLCAFLIFENAIIVNDSGIPIKFGGTTAFLDYGIYKNHISTAWTEITRPLKFLLFLLDDWQEAFSWLKQQPLKPGPIYPMIIGLTGFEEKKFLLSWIYQVAGAMLGWHWAQWLNNKSEPLWLQILSACFPALIYYAFLVSTDLLYAYLIALWLVGAWAVLEKKTWAWSWTVVAMFLLLLARPNSLALLPMMSLLAWQNRNLRVRLMWTLFWGLVGAYMLIYYLPYYWVHDSNAGVTHYWGLLPSAYYKGLWTDLPSWISQPLSWMIFAISKLIHAVGLRPSYASVELWLVITRAMPGLLFLPGLIYLLFSGHWFDRWFVFFFMLPIFIGASQERYLLALTPILLLWGVRAWGRAGRWGYHQIVFAKR